MDDQPAPRRTRGRFLGRTARLWTGAATAALNVAAIADWPIDWDERTTGAANIALGALFALLANDDPA